MSDVEKQKNLRITFKTWKELRGIKFRLGSKSYTDVIEQLMADNKQDLSQLQNSKIKDKVPTDAVNSKKKKDSGDKTIIIRSDVHRKLLDRKNAYALEFDTPTRGPNAISIDHILQVLIDDYKKNLK